MKELTCDIFIAGAGAAGMAAALSACAAGADVLLAEQDAQPGGILKAELLKVGSDIISARIGGSVTIAPAVERHLDISL